MSVPKPTPAALAQLDVLATQMVNTVVRPMLPSVVSMAHRVKNALKSETVSQSDHDLPQTAVLESVPLPVVSSMGVCPFSATPMNLSPFYVPKRTMATWITSPSFERRPACPSFDFGQSPPYIDLQSVLRIYDTRVPVIPGLVAANARNKAFLATATGVNQTALSDSEIRVPIVPFDVLPSQDIQPHAPIVFTTVKPVVPEIYRQLFSMSHRGNPYIVGAFHHVHKNQSPPRLKEMVEASQFSVRNGAPSVLFDWELLSRNGRRTTAFSEIAGMAGMNEATKALTQYFKSGVNQPLIMTVTGSSSGRVFTGAKQELESYKKKHPNFAFFTVNLDGSSPESCEALKKAALEVCEGQQVCIVFELSRPVATQERASFAQTLLKESNVAVITHPQPIDHPVLFGPDNPPSPMHEECLSGNYVLVDVSFDTVKPDAQGVPKGAIHGYADKTFHTTPDTADHDCSVLAFDQPNSSVQSADNMVTVEEALSRSKGKLLNVHHNVFPTLYPGASKAFHHQVEQAGYLDFLSSLTCTEGTLQVPKAFKREMTEVRAATLVFDGKVNVDVPGMEALADAQNLPKGSFNNWVQQHVIWRD